MALSYEHVLAAALRDKGYTLESTLVADDDLFPDYQHLILTCHGERPIDTIVLEGDLSCRDVLIGLVERYALRAAERRAKLERVLRVTHLR